MEERTLTDPKTGKVVRPTDNGLHNHDFYPGNQTPKVLFPGPGGKPYADLLPKEVAE